MIESMDDFKCKSVLTNADGLLHVGADEDTHEAFDAASAFFGQLSGMRP